MTPRDCAVLLGVGLAREEFVEQARDPRSHAALTMADTRLDSPRAWARYHKPAADRVHAALDDMRAFGALVVERWTALDQLDLVTRRYAVTVVMSHDSSGDVQMQHNYAAGAAFADAVRGYQGALHLCICHSSGLIPKIRATSADARLNTVGESAFLTDHASLLRATLRVLAKRPAPFQTVAAMVAQEFVLASARGGIR